MSFSESYENRLYEDRYGSGETCVACEEEVDDCSCKKEEDEGDPDRDRDIQRECQDAENAYEKDLFKGGERAQR